MSLPDTSIVCMCFLFGVLMCSHGNSLYSSGLYHTWIYVINFYGIRGVI